MAVFVAALQLRQVALCLLPLLAQVVDVGLHAQLGLQRLDLPRQAHHVGVVVAVQGGLAPVFRLQRLSRSTSLSTTSPEGMTTGEDGLSWASWAASSILRLSSSWMRSGRRRSRARCAPGCSG